MKIECEIISIWNYKKACAINTFLLTAVIIYKTTNNIQQTDAGE